MYSRFVDTSVVLFQINTFPYITDHREPEKKSARFWKEHIDNFIINKNNKVKRISSLLNFQVLKII